MGKRRKSGKSDRPKKMALPDAVSDDDDGDIIGTNLHGDEVDDYYDEQDHQLSLKLNARGASSRNFEDVNDVFGLSDSDDDFLDSHTKKNKKQKKEDLGDGEFDAEETKGSWGSKKKYFYGGNPNEKPKGSKHGKDPAEDENELNEAEAEEKESRFLQEKQLQNLTDEDFLFDVYGSSNKKKKPLTKKSEKESDTNLENVKLDLSKLSRREKVRLFERECPEFSLIVGEFNVRMEEIGQIYQPLVELMQKGVIPGNGPAAEYIKMKHQIAINYGVNMACYLMFKSRKVDLKMHPLTARLVQYKNLLDELESKLDPVVDDQVRQILELVSDDGGIKKLKKLVNKSKQLLPVKKAFSKKPKKTLKLLQKKNIAANGQEDRNLADQINEFTPDEQMALQMMAGRKKIVEDSDDDDEEDEEKRHDDDFDGDDDDKRRSITYEMSKNKGLMPKRSKLQRNPRVKHRVKYEKAKIRRKGQVREVRTEVKKYGGEISGINKRVKKGIKLA